MRMAYLCGFDTPTVQSGGILASSEVACCCRSYAKSTSVLLPVYPTAKLKNGSHDASSGVQPFGIKARHQRTLVFDTLTPRTSMHAQCTTENSEFEESIVSGCPSGFCVAIFLKGLTSLLKWFKSFNAALAQKPDGHPSSRRLDDAKFIPPL